MICGRRPQVDEAEDLQEEEEQRDAHDDLRGHEREQHQRVDGAAAAAAPALQPERERDAEGYGDRDADDREEAACA